MLWIATDMADKRKLQGEIERCLKKVSEGVETFEDIWQKIYTASNANQKEKYEADLKKEIKKLQRLRDQIKTWLTSSDIKDKSLLQDNRKLIEIQMERFKVVERETKTKAYSKEGLGAAQKLDPAQKEKDDIANWLTESINSLSIQVDHYESELETLGAVTKKKKGAKEKSHRLDELKRWLEKHRYHINQLETLLRMLDNSTIEVNQVKKVQDDVNHYIESSQETDFQENTYIYDDLNLDGFEEYLIRQKSGSNSENDVKLGAESDEVNTGLSSMSTSTNSSSSACNSGLTNHSNDCESDSPTKSLVIKSNHISSVSMPNNSASIKSITTSKNVSLAPTSSSITTSCQVLNSNNSVTAPAVMDGLPSTETKNMCQSTTSSIPDNCQLLNCERSESVNDANLSTFSKMQNNFSTHITHSQDLTSTVEQPVRSQPTVENPKCYQAITVAVVPVSNMNIECRSSSEELHNCVTESEANNTVTSNSQMQATEVTISPSHSTKVEDLTSLLYNVQQSLLNGELESQHHIINSGNSTANTPIEPAQPSTPSPPPPFKLIKMPVSPILGYYPITSASAVQESLVQMRRLEQSNKRLPQPMDSEKLRKSLARTPCNVPEYYKLQLPCCDSFDFFQHLSTETLFFIFYYMEGSKAQYLAAKTLKKQSWRFHTRYMLWFQRHEEPKTITDEYEQGTYIYFDFERWSQRKKDGFTFEYRYLEDQDLN